MAEYKYSLAKKGKWLCPRCGQKTFVRYVDSDTSRELHPSVGRCDREEKCGYHFSPREYFIDNGNPMAGSYSTDKNHKPNIYPTPPFTSFISNDVLKDSLTNYDNNNLVLFLRTILSPEELMRIINKYSIGTSGHWPRSTVFWQIDTQGRIRTGKIMQYDPVSGHRIKQPSNRIGWIHTLLNEPNYNLTQCFFGEHLLADSRGKVAIVESEKTAIIASAFLPDLTWLASGGVSILNPSRCSCLQGREVILFPDAMAYDKWKIVADKLKPLCKKISVSDLLEKRATAQEKEEGLDIADYLIREALSRSITTPVHAMNDITPPLDNKLASYSLSTEWESEIAALEEFYRTQQFPLHAFSLGPGCTILNIQAFYESHLAIVKAYPNKCTFRPYLDRLKDFKKAYQHQGATPKSD
jgi:hypothetical protein